MKKDMKKTKYIFGCLMLFLSISACSEGVETVSNSKRIVEVSASMPESGTRASLTQESGTLNLIARWKADDKIRLYVLQDGKDYSIEPVNVQNVSADGKSCSFAFELPTEVMADYPYELYGLCDAIGEPLGNESTVLVNCRLQRMPWSSYTVPLWFHTTVGPTSIYAEFRHMGTYEILHVKNTSTVGVMFSHSGFDVEMPWWEDGYIPLSDDYDPAAIVEEPSDDSSSSSVFIPAGQTKDFLSWYIPSGASIKDASLLATIDGKKITSSNKKNSNVKIQLRHAYHMYATWDGTELKFDKTDVIEGKVIKVEPGKISFGTVPVGTSKTEHLTVSNVGTSSLTFNVRDTHGVMDGVFDIPESGNEYTLAAGESKIFDVNFTPKGVGVHYSWIVPIYSDADNGTETTIISGTGAEGGNPSYPVAEAIDLGLPSGTLWASWNVGASSPEEYGGYYAWGETEEKDNYSWSTYTLCDGSYSTCHHIGDDIAGTEYDVAHVKWGGSWYMPSINQIKELRDNCTQTWTKQNGVYGIRVTGPNGNTIFIPAAGYRTRDSLYGEGENGACWSSSLYSNYSYSAYGLLNFLNEYWDWSYYDRSIGYSVRAVISPEKPQDCPVAEAIDLGLPSGTKWASWNVGASAPEEYGGYYAWGETEEKDYYDWDTYTHCDGSRETCHHIGDDIAGTEYDVAHVKWGGSWRMPTRAQQDELRENCTREWTQQNGVNGSRVTGPNGNSIFLPAAGGRWRGYHNYEGTNGHFWSSSLNSDLEYGACYLGFVTYWWDWGNDRSRSYGNSVRPVCP